MPKPTLAVLRPLAVALRIVPSCEILPPSSVCDARLACWVFAKVSMLLLSRLPKSANPLPNFVCDAITARCPLIRLSADGLVRPLPAAAPPSACSGSTRPALSLIKYAWLPCIKTSGPRSFTRYVDPAVTKPPTARPPLSPLNNDCSF